MDKRSAYNQIKFIFFNSQGRLSREFFTIALALLSIFIFIGIPLIDLIGELILPNFLRALIVFISSLYATYAGFVISIKRLHDLNLTGWLSILNLAVPLSFLFIAYLVFAKGSKGDNKYGEPFKMAHPPLLIKVSYGFLVICGIFTVVMGFAFLKGIKEGTKAGLSSGAGAIVGKAMTGAGKNYQEEFKKIEEEFKKAPRSMGMILIDNQISGAGVSIAKDRVMLVGAKFKEKIQTSLSAGKRVEIRFTDKSSANLTRLLVFNDSPSVQVSVFLINPSIGTPGVLGGQSKKLLNEMNAFQ